MPLITSFSLGSIEKHELMRLAVHSAPAGAPILGASDPRAMQQRRSYDGTLTFAGAIGSPMHLQQPLMVPAGTIPLPNMSVSAGNTPMASPARRTSR